MFALLGGDEVATGEIILPETCGDALTATNEYISIKHIPESAVNKYIPESAVDGVIIMDLSDSSTEQPAYIRKSTRRKKPVLLESNVKYNYRAKSLSRYFK